MSITVNIPGVYRHLTGGGSTFDAGDEQSDVGKVLIKVFEAFPALQSKMFDAKGKPLKSVNVFVREEDIRFLDGFRTIVDRDSVVDIIPAIAGGRPCW